MTLDGRTMCFPLDGLLVGGVDSILSMVSSRQNFRRAVSHRLRYGTAVTMSSDRESGTGGSAVGSLSTSMSLLERAKLQDPEAWSRLVKLYGPLIYLWCRKAGLAASDTEDIVQDVFTRLVTNLGGFRRDRPGDSFRKWLRTIAANAVRDFFRRRKGRVQAQGGTEFQRQLAETPAPQVDTPGEEEASKVESADGDQAVWVLVNRAMESVRGRVKPHNWQAFCEVMVNDRVVKDVADELGLPAGSVYDAKYRVLRMLRKELSDWLD